MLAQNDKNPVSYWCLQEAAAALVLYAIAAPGKHIYDIHTRYSVLQTVLVHRVDRTIKGNFSVKKWREKKLASNLETPFSPFIAAAAAAAVHKKGMGGGGIAAAVLACVRARPRVQPDMLTRMRGSKVIRMSSPRRFRFIIRGFFRCRTSPLFSRTKPRVWCNPSSSTNACDLDTTLRDTFPSPATYKNLQRRPILQRRGARRRYEGGGGGLR